MLNPVGTQVIHTPHLLLRRFTEADAEQQFQTWANDPDVTRYLSWNPHGDLSITRGVIDSWVRGYDDPTSFLWAISIRQSNQLVGSISLLHVDTDKQEAEIAYAIGKKYWGLGITTEACRAVIHYAFDTVGFLRVYGRHHIDNPASGKAMMKSGLRHIGTTHEPWLKDPSQMVYYQQYEIRKQNYLAQESVQNQ